MTYTNHLGHEIHGTVGGKPATMSVLLEDGEVEILAPPFFRMDEEGALALSRLLVKQTGAWWIALLEDWNPSNEIDDGK